jgi:hypothetical protein
MIEEIQTKSQQVLNMLTPAHFTLPKMAKSLELLCTSPTEGNGGN